MQREEPNQGNEEIMQKSITATQTGFGTALHKRVNGLKLAERAAIAKGKTVYFASHPTYIKPGVVTSWRVAIKGKRKDEYYPRVPSAEQLAAIAVLEGGGK